MNYEEICAFFSIPPSKKFGYGFSGTSLTKSLGLMKVGEKTRIDKKYWTSLHQCAKQAGVEIITRSAGRDSSMVMVWRVK